jgi:hypothetical protein
MRAKVMVGGSLLLMASLAFSYSYPTGGGVLAVSLIMAVGFLNSLLDARSVKAGLLVGAVSASLVLAACMGAGSQASSTLLLAGIAALFGFGFASQRVVFVGSAEGGDAQASKDRIRSGGGGDFGGGGAGGRF